MQMGLQQHKFPQQNHNHHQAQGHHQHQQHPNSHGHPTNVNHQYTHSGGGLANTTPHFSAAHVQNGTPNNAQEAEEPMTEHWQLQLQKAAETRRAASPHSIARAHGKNSQGGTFAGQANGSQDDDEEDGEYNRVIRPKKSPPRSFLALDMGGQSLKALASAVFDYTFLTQLHINHNKIQRLPSTIGKMRNLELLNASSNLLQDLPPEIGMLTSLKELLLFDNQLEHLPFEIGGLFKLEMIGIEGNPVDDVTKWNLVHEGTKGLVKYLREHTPGRCLGLTCLKTKSTDECYRV